MDASGDRRIRTDHPLFPWLLGLAALILAALSALPYAGSWNDGSRLAAVESLGDRRTFAIDDSIFCRPSADSLARGCPPYRSADLLAHGTRDKLFIDGHFYSDKPGLISLLMAGLYKAEQLLGLPSARERPDLFCWTLTLATSGLAYVVSLLALHRLGRLFQLPPAMHCLWLASFALSTFALTYTRHVNNHILLLAVLLLTCVQLVRLARECEEGCVSWWRLAGLGTLAGLGFNLDLGSGPLFAAGLFVVVAYRCRRPGPVFVFLLTTAPWVIAGMAINYSIGGVWKPVNMVSEYMNWPGCPFTPENMTGFSRHGPFHFLVYSLSLLFGKKGVLIHNLPLLLALPALVRVLRRSTAHRPELVFVLAWCAASWLMYAVLSNNSGGACCSIRWFVPFLGAGYFLLAVHLRDWPASRRAFVVLSLGGGLLAGLMWRAGPWTLHMVPLLWPIVVMALLGWGYIEVRRFQGERTRKPYTLMSPLAPDATSKKHAA